MLTNTLYVLQGYKDIQDSPWAQNKRDDWNKHTSEAAVIPYKYIRMIWVHCNKMESIPGGKSIVDLLSQLWEYVLKVVHKRNLLTAPGMERKLMQAMQEQQPAI